jgi:hypothetical protein
MIKINCECPDEECQKDIVEQVLKDLKDAINNKWIPVLMDGKQTKYEEGKFDGIEEVKKGVLEIIDKLEEK